MCINCSGVHRNLGTHISQVRSISLDTDCWQGKLVDFMCSVGNRAFNRIWEAGVTTAGGIRPQEYPNRPSVRIRFIIRKYRDKAFMNYNLGCIPDPLPSFKNDASFESFQSLSSAQTSTLPSQPIDANDILKAGIVSKYGGKDSAIFHKWQKRWIIITKDGRFYYCKTQDTAPVGQVPLQFQPVLEPDGDVKFQFSISTPNNSNHQGRK